MQENINVKTMAQFASEGKEPDILYWVGCAGSFDARAIKVSKAFVKLLNKAGVSFAILGNQESCCGDPARRAGNEFVFQMLALQNIEVLKGYNIKKIVTTIIAAMVLGSLSNAATVKLAPIMVGDITTFVPYLPAPIETLHATYHPDETVSVQVNIPRSGDHDWAGVFRVGDSSDRTHAIAWNWVSGDTTLLDRDKKPMPAGEYEVRLFFHDSTYVEATYRFTVQNRPQAHDLNIMIAASGSGATITSLKSHGTELAATGSKLFDLTLKNLDNNTLSRITSSAGWGSVSLRKTGEEYAIDFANPQDNTLPQTLAVSMHIVINNGNASQWDMNVTGIGAHHSLVNVRAPELHLRMKPNAKLLLPKYSGLLRDVNDLSMMSMSPSQKTMH